MLTVAPFLEIAVIFTQMLSSVRILSEYLRNYDKNTLNLQIIRTLLRFCAENGTLCL